MSLLRKRVHEVEIERAQSAYVARVVKSCTPSSEPTFKTVGKMGSTETKGVANPLRHSTGSPVVPAGYYNYTYNNLKSENRINNTAGFEDASGLVGLAGVPGATVCQRVPVFVLLRLCLFCFYCL